MIPKRLLAALAPYEPINGDELGGCMHCSHPLQGRLYAGRFLEDHEPGCPWIKARRLLGDKLPARRETAKTAKTANERASNPHEKRP